MIIYLLIIFPEIKWKIFIRRMEWTKLLMENNTMSDKDGEIPQFNQKLIMMVQNQRAVFFWGG